MPAETNLLTAFESNVLSGDYKEYFKIKRNNFIARIQEFPSMWKVFQLLDEIWIREFRDLENPIDKSHILPLLLLSSAHAKFRIAMELGFCSCINEGCNTLRSGIESVAHACKLLREPELREVWQHKDDGPEQKRKFKKHFEDNKRTCLFSSRYGLEKLYDPWSRYSEWATHATATAIALRAQRLATPDDVNWMLNYFEVDTEEYASSHFSMMETSYLMENAFFQAFEDRLQFDNTLIKMRTEFREQMGQLSKLIIKQFRLKPPTIWP
jgi:hypothetical protein